jgi:hypothetical protein
MFRTDTDAGARDVDLDTHCRASYSRAHIDS